MSDRQLGPAKNWIDGAWNESGEIKISTSPSTGETLGRYVAASPQAAQLAITAAQRAFETTGWAEDRNLRSRALHQIAERLTQRQHEIALMLSREGGKLLSQTQWEVNLALGGLRYAAATAVLQTAGRAMETAPGIYFYSDPLPLGVAGVITPWNSPIALSVRSFAPALAAGCAVVLKLPPQTALTNALFGEAIAATELLPPGILNIVTGSGIAEILVDSPDVAVICYTGSTKIGRTIAANAAKTLKRVCLELGGKTPLVVFDDVDLDAVVPQLVMALVAMNGQFCCTGSRVLAQRGIADRLRVRLVAALGAVRLGVSEDPDAQLGPLVDRQAVERVNQIVAEAASYGKILVRGGPVTAGPLARGCFYEPSLIEVEALDSFIVQHEVFGPVQTFEIFDDEADAIRRANATEYGLAASVFSADFARARRVGKKIQAGDVWLNGWAIMSDHFEQSGDKQSGIGALAGPQAIREFQKIKVYAASETSPASA